MTGAGSTVRFRCDAESLADGLTLAFRASPPKTALPAQAGVLLRAEESGRLVLSATDGELTVRTSVPAEVTSPGEAVLHRLFGDIVRSLKDGAVEITVDDVGMASISSGRSHFSLRTYPREDYPTIAVPDAEFTDIEATGLGRRIDQVTTAASTDRSRPVLTGVSLALSDGGTRLVATDSYRLVVTALDTQDLVPEDENVLIPARALREVGRLLGDKEAVSVAIDDRRVAFRLGATEIISSLIEGDFPKYQQLLPDQLNNKLEIARSTLLDALRRVGLLARDTTPIRLALSEEEVTLQAIDPELGGEADEEVDAIYTGEEMTVAFNPAFLRDGIDACDADKVTIEFSAPLKPAIITDGGEEGFLYLIMPVRV